MAPLLKRVSTPTPGWKLSMATAALPPHQQTFWCHSRPRRRQNPHWRWRLNKGLNWRPRLAMDWKQQKWSEGNAQDQEGNRHTGTHIHVIRTELNDDIYRNRWWIRMERNDNNDKGFISLFMETHDASQERNDEYLFKETISWCTTTTSSVGKPNFVFFNIIKLNYQWSFLLFIIISLCKHCQKSSWQSWSPLCFNLVSSILPQRFSLPATYFNCSCVKSIIIMLNSITQTMILSRSRARPFCWGVWQAVYSILT